MRDCLENQAHSECGGQALLPVQSLIKTLLPTIQNRVMGSVRLSCTVYICHMEDC